MGEKKHTHTHLLSRKQALQVFFFPASSGQQLLLRLCSEDGLLLHPQSSWQHHQTFMREREGKSVKDSLDSGIPNERMRSRKVNETHLCAPQTNVYVGCWLGGGLRRAVSQFLFQVMLHDCKMFLKAECSNVQVSGNHNILTRTKI